MTLRIKVFILNKVQNGNLGATARQLEIAMQMLSNWQNKANEGKLIGTK